MYQSDPDWKKLYYNIWALITQFTSDSSHCIRCGKKFQAIYYNTCHQHPTTSVYPSVTMSDRILEDRVGLHKCCGTKTFRFNITVNGGNTGCKSLVLGLVSSLAIFWSIASKEENTRENNSIGYAQQYIDNKILILNYWNTKNHQK